jgi:hypothetical protein
LVDSADRIVRATAVSADTRAQTVTFAPSEWIRTGETADSTLTLNGIAVAHDDFNDGKVPYRLVRPAGRRGSCFALEYRLGAQYLLLLSSHPLPNTIQWWPLAPVNEQLRGDEDPWLTWVRQEAARRP